MLGYIHSFESLAAVDGAGLRYGVFLSGCPLRCLCCHNPDTWSLTGNAYTAEDLSKKILRYKPYFQNGGGVTFSGGEPLLQADFLCEIIPYLQNAGISYIIDTSGCVTLSENVKKVIDNSESVLLDLKFYNDELYKKYTSMGISNTLDTLNYLESIKKKVWIRTVVIPGINDTETEISKYISIIKDYRCVEKYELLAFHTMGFFKYENLGIENKLKQTSALGISVKDRLQNFVNTQLNNS